jgi:DNA-binding transcriptional ArsR family regulator
MNKAVDALEEALFKALGTDERRDILPIVAGKESVSYTQILGELNMTTGNLNYHLKQLEGFVEKDDERKYRLTPLGETATSVLTTAANRPDGFNGFIELALSSQASSIHPTVANLFRLGLVFNLLILLVWSYLGYVLLIEGGPLFAKVVLGVLICFSVVILTWLIRSLRTAPRYDRRLERALDFVSR